MQNRPEVAAYFEKLLQSRLHSPPIRCGSAGDKGKAMYADRALKAGEPIWTEAPFVAMQHEDNKEFVDCCDNCFVPLIDSKACWARVVASSSEVEGEAAPADESAASDADFEAAIAFLQKEGGKSPEESYFSVFKLAENQVKCTCGALYCSDNCKQIAYAQHHAMLCPHSEERDNAIGTFLNHTLVTNEIFQLAAKVVAKILLLFVATQDMAQARQPVDMFCKLPWWEVITSEDDLEEGETLEDYRDKFRSLIAQTFEYFSSGIKENLAHLEAQGELNGLSADAVLASCEEVLNVDFFSCVVGMFEMNNISMEIDHPLHALGEALSEASPEDKKDMPPVLSRVKAALEKFAEEHKHQLCDCEADNDHEHEHGEEECYALDEDFVGVEGTALFSGICTMNHSCDPNCTVLYTKDGAAHVFAVQDIAEGEELCISYIDVDQEVNEREECLRPLQRRRLGQWQRIRCAMFIAATAIASVAVDAATVVGTFSPQNCVKCAGLQYCTIMNGQYLFDPIAGYSRETTTQLEKQGVCEDLDAKTLALSPFGTHMQFKDTATCHKLVWNFHCLSLVATTFQREVNGTPVSCAKTDGSATVPLPPCRSLCVEVADKCVYSHFYRMYLDEVCGNIACLTEIQEFKNTGTTDPNVAETTCVSGSWVYAENKTFSRCSTRTYEPPAAMAVHGVAWTFVVVLGVLNVLCLA